jgi:hypothetical protein
LENTFDVGVRFDKNGTSHSFVIEDLAADETL